MRVRSLDQEDSPGGGHGSPLQYSCKLPGSLGIQAWRNHHHALPDGVVLDKTLESPHRALFPHSYSHFAPRCLSPGVASMVSVHVEHPQEASVVVHQVERVSGPCKFSSTYFTVSSGSVSPKVASTSQKGVVQLATTAEATTGTNTEKAVTPAGLQAALDASGNGSIVPVLLLELTGVAGQCR